MVPASHVQDMSRSDTRSLVSQYHMMAHGIFPSSPFVFVMDVYYVCVGAVLVRIGVRIFIILNIVLCIL